MATDSQTSKTNQPSPRKQRKWKSYKSMLRARAAQLRNHHKMRVCSFMGGLQESVHIKETTSLRLLTTKEAAYIYLAQKYLRAALEEWDKTTPKDLNPVLFED